MKNLTIIFLAVLFFCSTAYAGIFVGTGSGWSTVSAVQKYDGAVWQNITPSIYVGGQWYAMLSYVDYHFYVVLGQSNACGHGEVPSSVSGVGAYELRADNALITPVADSIAANFGKTTTGFSEATDGSSWPSFSLQYATIANQIPITMILGCPGAGLTVRWYAGHPIWKASAAELYTSAINYIDAGLAKLTSDGLNYDFRGIIWWQGETDALNSVSTANYQIELEALINGLLNHYSAYSDLKFYIIKIQNNGGGYTAIRLADDNVAAENSDVYIAYENLYTGDGHHSTAQYDIIGAAVANFIYGVENP